jgi:hypothetical protein
LEKDKLNEEAWLLFADASETKSDELICLQNVKRINPNNAIANQRLQSLINIELPPKEKKNKSDYLL